MGTCGNHLLIRPGPPFFIDADGDAAHEFFEENEAGQRRCFAQAQQFP